MKRFYKPFSILLLLFMLIGNSNTISAQGIGTSGRFINLPDTANMGDTLNFAYELVNKSPLPLNSGVIVASLMEVNGNLLPSPVSTFTLPLLINPGDTIVIPIQDFVVSPQNQNNGGANIIVVWPTTPGNGAQDSTRDTMHVNEESTFRSESLNEDSWAVFPNPVRDFVRVSFRKPNNMAGIRIYDVSGKAQYFRRDAEDLLFLGDLPTGTYILEVQDKDGKVGRRKIFVY